jgi:hypothetical protein
VLASLNTARSKGKDAKFTAEMSGIRSAAEVVYSDNGSSYNSPTLIFTNSVVAGSQSQILVGNGTLAQYVSSLKATSGNTTLYGGLSSGAYAIYGVLPSKTMSSPPAIGEMFCVDSTGKSGVNIAAYVAADVAAVPLTSCTHN